MPIVVAILGVILVIMGVLFFTLSPAEKTPVVNPELNRPEVEVTIEEEAAPADTTSLDDEVAESALVLTGSATYQTPARVTLEVDVTLTVTDGIVTDAKVVYDNGDGYSNPNQERFDGAYKAEVIGKPLDDISLSRVGGASLTSAAFNEAVASIRAKQT